MRSKEEISALKEEVENMSRKRRELTDEDLVQVSGGMSANDLLKTGSNYMNVDRANKGYAHVQGKYDAPD